jgi:hypothetical protein
VVGEIDDLVTCAGPPEVCPSTQSATALAWRPGRVLPTMIPIFTSVITASYSSLIAAQSIPGMHTEYGPREPRR